MDDFGDLLLRAWQETNRDSAHGLSFVNTVQGVINDCNIAGIVMATMGIHDLARDLRSGADPMLAEQLTAAWHAQAGQCKCRSARRKRKHDFSALDLDKPRAGAFTVHVNPERPA